MSINCTPVSPPQVKQTTECIAGLEWLIDWVLCECTEDGSGPFLVWRETGRSNTGNPCP